MEKCLKFWILIWNKLITKNINFKVNVFDISTTTFFSNPNKKDLVYLFLNYFTKYPEYYPYNFYLLQNYHPLTVVLPIYLQFSSYSFPSLLPRYLDQQDVHYLSLSQPPGFYCFETLPVSETFCPNTSQTFLFRRISLLPFARIDILVFICLLTFQLFLNLAVKNCLVLVKYIVKLLSKMD